MSAFSLFGGRFDRDPADCFWTERDEPEEERCPECGQTLADIRTGGSPCTMCFFYWDVDELAAVVEPPEVE